MKIRRDKRDKVFSDLVRERANWTCQVCNKYFPEGARRGLECSHHFSRRNKSVRFDPDNASAMCVYDHQTLGENPPDFTDWIESELHSRAVRLACVPNAKRVKDLTALRVVKNQIVRLKKHHLEEIYENLKASYECMLSRRAAYEDGWLEFEDPYPAGVR